MHPVVRQIPEEDREAYARTVESWGFPRKISDREIAEDYWVCDQAGQLGALWFSPVFALEGETLVRSDCLSVHACARPGVGGLELVAWATELIRTIGGLRGARRVYSALPDSAEALGFPVRQIRRLLEMHGWLGPDELGQYLDLEG